VAQSTVDRHSENGIEACLKLKNKVETASPKMLLTLAPRQLSGPSPHACQVSLVISMCQLCAVPKPHWCGNATPELLRTHGQDFDNIHRSAVDVGEILHRLLQLSWLQYHYLLRRNSLEIRQDLSEPPCYGPPGLLILTFMKFADCVSQFQSCPVETQLRLPHIVDVLLDRGSEVLVGAFNSSTSLIASASSFFLQIETRESELQGFDRILVCFQKCSQALLFSFKLHDDFIGGTECISVQDRSNSTCDTYQASEAKVPAPASAAMLAPVTSSDGRNKTAAAPARPKPIISPVIVNEQKRIAQTFMDSTQCWQKYLRSFSTPELRFIL
jgi:hypothetical protein